MRIYPFVFTTCFSWMDAETAHKVGFEALKIANRIGLGKPLYKLTAPQEDLKTQVFGQSFPSPFGLAAGFDKDGTGILALANLGFGFIEVGTITAQGQSGNEKPRLFRLIEDKALINRMGFNNNGADTASTTIFEAKKKLEERFGSRRPRIGVNIGKTKVTALEDAAEDYAYSTHLLAPVADYLVVNVSSPNTPGLRQLQDIKHLGPLLRTVRSVADTSAGGHVPLLVKVSPDMLDADLEAVAELSLRLRLDGIIVTNTTIDREGLRTSPEKLEKIGPGGLSGVPLTEKSAKNLDKIHQLVGHNMAVISAGGITTGDDVVTRLESGAHLTQGYTAFLYEGPLWGRMINKTLSGVRQARKIPGRS